MSSTSVVTITTGVSGSGKTYYRCAVFLVEEWLPNHSGKLISNYPIKIDELKKDYGDGIVDRIEIIDKDVLDAWRKGESGPWDYFSGRDISGCHIAIDEIHNFCPKTADNKLRKKWMQFVGELRHMGATIEFLTQNEAKCAKELLAEAEIRYEILNGANFKFPVLGYRMGDLYQFRAKLLRKYICPSYCIEYTQVGGKWVKKDEHLFYRLPSYFKYYDSFSAPEHGLALGHEPEKMPWEKYGWLRLFLWFYLTYPFRISFHVGCIVFFVWFFFLGGMKGCSRSYLSAIGAIDKKPKENKVEKVDDPEKKVLKSVIPEGSVVVDHRENPFKVCSTTYLKLVDGRVFQSGDEFFHSRISHFIPRMKVCVLEDGFFFPISWFLED